ncbi:MAG: DUF488 domain-containing protein [Polyangiaceae bacterium]
MLYTIGHSTRTFDELVEVLKAWDVTRLIDIRTFTRSRTNPQFNAAALARRLPKHSIAYEVMAELGGRRPKSKSVAPERNAGWRVQSFHNYADYAESSDFACGLTRLLERTAGETCAIMCAEAVWWRCHRRIVTDYALTRGVKVQHLFTTTKAERATRTPFAKLDRKHKTLRYPPVP